jgi:hypothetical protein
MRRALAFATGLVAVLLSGSAALAQTMDIDNPTCPGINAVFGPLAGPMSVQFEKVSGRRVLKLQGAIAPGVADQLQKAFTAHQPIDEIWLGSSGGDAGEGLKIGKAIRQLGLPTRVPGDWGCASACNFAFLGGPIRTVDDKAVFAVHMFTITNSADYRAFVDWSRKAAGADPILNNIARREQASALLASDENDFMIRMGVSRRLLTEIMYRQKADAFDAADKSTLRCLTAAEMATYNVVNAD